MTKYCTKCGKEIDQDAVICPHCGCSVNEIKKNKEQDSDNVGWGFLGFFVPIAGLILWLIWKDEAPKKAKNLGIGALVSVCLAVLTVIVVYVILPLCLVGLSVSGAATMGLMASLLI